MTDTPEQPVKRILSLGAGVQSTCVLLMSGRGELPKLDCAVFSDTGWEPPEVYEHFAWLVKDVDLRTDTDMGQLTMWDEECDGMCGV